jgi:hypothetical protein
MDEIASINLLQHLALRTWRVEMLVTYHKTAACNIAGSLASQKGDAVRNFLRLSQSAHGRLLNVGFEL